MKYTKPELEWIRFENVDILTNSLPPVIFKVDDEQSGNF